MSSSTSCSYTHFNKNTLLTLYISIKYEKFKANKEVMRSRKQKDRHTTMTESKRNKATMVYKTLHRKLKIEQHKPH